MAFSRTWNSSYEASPANTDDISNDAEVTRQLKVDLRERLEVDHSWGGDASDGQHKKATLVKQDSDPSAITDTAILFSKDDGSGIPRLHYVKEDGSVHELSIRKVTTEGDIIVADSNGEASRLAIGAANTLPRSDGTTLSYGKVVYADLNLSNDLTQGDIANDAIGQNELKEDSGTVSTQSTGGTNRILPGGARGFYPRTAVTRPNGDETSTARIRNESSNDSFNPIIWLRLEDPGGGSTGTASASQHYIQSSPPYDMGDGECGLFVELDIRPDKTIAGAYVAADPVWANNGPTDIAPDRIDRKTGKKYKSIRCPELTCRDLHEGRCDVSEYMSAQKEAPIEEIEVTHEYKRKDMGVIPHSWVSPPDGTICLLDPVDTFDLLALHEAGEDIADLLHRGYIRIGDECKRCGPPGVVPVMWKWKRSK